VRNAFVVCYDISDPKRWRRVYKLLMGVGDPVQFSVFRCDLSRSEKVLLLEKLIDVINQAEDRVMFVQLGPAGDERTAEDRIETWGKPLAPMPTRGPIIV
jgi:CRISPR-associated protein Cas2